MAENDQNNQENFLKTDPLSMRDGQLENQDKPIADEEDSNDILNKLGLSKKQRLKKENDDLQQQLSELNDRYLRLFAEFDNFKKRNARERNEFAKTANSDVLSALLPVLDDFSRAMKQMENAQSMEAIQEGVALIQQKLFTVLENKGVKPMKSLGEVFNPELHEAIAELNVDDNSLKGKVVDEIESGYFLNDKILRHAKVVVGK
jgi:molecular chaperone GrpE